MIDPGKLPNCTSLWRVLTCKSVAGTRTSFSLSSRCRKSISEIIVSVFQEHDDPRHRRSICFTKTITSYLELNSRDLPPAQPPTDLVDRPRCLIATYLLWVGLHIHYCLLKASLPSCTWTLDQRPVMGNFSSS